MKTSPLYILLLLMLQSPFLLKGQPPEIAHLLRQLSVAKADSTKVQLYMRIGNQYVQHNADIALGYYKQAGDLSRKMKYINGVSAYYAATGEVLRRMGLSDSSLAVGLESLEWAKKANDSTSMAKALMNIGIEYTYLADFENAVKYCEEGRDLFNRLGNLEFEGQVYDVLQGIAREMRQYRKAAAYGLKAVEKLKLTADSVNLSYAYNNLGLTYIELKEYALAASYLEKGYALALLKKLPDVQILYNLNQGYIALLQGHFGKMKPFLDKALALSTQLNAPEYRALAMWGLSNYFLSAGEYAISRQYADSALHIASSHNMKSVRLRVLPTLSNIAFAQHDTQSGFSYLNQYLTLNDSVLNESVTKNTIAIEKRYETEKKENQIKLQQAKIEQKNTLNSILIGGTITLLLLFLLSYRNYKNRQKLQQQRILELETEKLLTATEAVLKGEEQERTRLAKDLHDGLGGMLSGIKHSFTNMKENLIMTPENAQAFERGINLLDNSIREMRRVAHNMMPEILMQFGLDTALKELCLELNRSGSLQATYQSVDMDTRQFDRALSVTAYRVVQELAGNVLKHAAAGSLLVQAHASYEDHLLQLTVEDDGKGFDPSILNHSGGMGWKSIRNRIELLKGRIDINTAPGKGTSVLIELPLP